MPGAVAAPAGDASTVSPLMVLPSVWPSRSETVRQAGTSSRSCAAKPRAPSARIVAVAAPAFRPSVDGWRVVRSVSSAFTAAASRPLPRAMWPSQPAAAPAPSISACLIIALHLLPPLHGSASVTDTVLVDFTAGHRR